MSDQPGRTCFFICPLGEPDSPERFRSDKVLRHIVKPAVERNGDKLTVVRLTKARRE